MRILVHELRPEGRPSQGHFLSRASSFIVSPSLHGCQEESLLLRADAIRKLDIAANCEAYRITIEHISSALMHHTHCFAGAASWRSTTVPINGSVSLRLQNLLTQHGALGPDNTPRQGIRCARHSSDPSRILSKGAVSTAAIHNISQFSIPRGCIDAGVPTMATSSKFIIEACALVALDCDNSNRAHQHSLPQTVVQQLHCAGSDTSSAAEGASLPSWSVFPRHYWQDAG